MRLFFALWPDESVRERLSKVAAGLPRGSGRCIRRDNLHLTLAFLGSVSEPAVTELQRRMAGVRQRPFSLVFDHLGWFRRTGVIWLASSRVPAALTDLVGCLRASARDCQIQVDDRPFRPHLTLTRKARAYPGRLEFEPIRWDIDEFCLIHSETRPQGAEYRVLDRRALSFG